MSSPTIDFKKVLSAINVGIEALGGEDFDEKKCECKYYDEDVIQKCQYCALHEAVILARAALIQNYVVVFADDWEALYINGKLYDEGHSLQYNRILKEIGFNLEEKEANAEWLEEQGGEFPVKLFDCRFER